MAAIGLLSSPSNESLRHSSTTFADPWLSDLETQVPGRPEWSGGARPTRHRRRPPLVKEAEGAMDGFGGEFTHRCVGAVVWLAQGGGFFVNPYGALLLS